MLHLDKGFGEDDHTQVTDDDGKIQMVMNEHDDVTATLTLTKDGYKSWSQQFKRAPKMSLDICLDPAAP